MTDNTGAGPRSRGDLYLLRGIPHVLRARGYRLYLAEKNGSGGNRRLTDLWLNGGAAVLGHTPANLLREIKNSAERGLYAPFPHFTEGRLIKALSQLLPERVFRLYAAPPEETSTLYETGRIKLWRPYIDQASPFKTDDAPIIIPVLPGIQTWRNGLPLGLCIIAAKNNELLSQFPQSESLSPVLSAAAAHGIYDILASPQRGKPNLPIVKKAINNSLWYRQGIYLTLKKETDDKEWEALFQKFLEAGFLLPPVQTHPLILPAEMSSGEEKKLAAVLK